jgi:hypothetical protein
MFIYSISSEKGNEQVLSLISPEAIYNKNMPSETIVGKLAKDLSENDKINFNNFIPNLSFINFLHDVIAKHGSKVSSLSAQAQKQKKGWVYLIDGRCSDSQGEVLPEDIIGSFEVIEGQIIPNSYQKNSKHLIFSKKGLFKLQSTLNKHLMQESLKLLEKAD